MSDRAPETFEQKMRARFIGVLSEAISEAQAEGIAPAKILQPPKIMLNVGLGVYANQLGALKTAMELNLASVAFYAQAQLEEGGQTGPSTMN